jgi:hypothetical protein
MPFNRTRSRKKALRSADRGRPRFGVRPEGTARGGDAGRLLRFPKSLSIYPTEFAGTAQHTLIDWHTDDLVAVDELAAKG